MAIQAYEIKAKRIFFSDTLNLTPGKIIVLDTDKVDLLSKEQLGDIIEGFLLDHLEVGQDVLESVLSKYVSLKYPELKNSDIFINNGLIVAHPKVPK